MKAGDKFYQIVSPMKPMILSGKANERETEGSIIIDGKMRKIGEWYPEEHWKGWQTRITKNQGV